MNSTPSAQPGLPLLPHLAALTAGLLIVWLACAHIPLLGYVENFPVFRRQQLPAYALFDPAQAAEPKHVFVGSSYIINAWVTNDLSRPGWPEIEDPQSSYAATARLVAAREFGASGQSFFEAGRPGPGFLDHIWYIHHALRASNLKTVIYANGHSGMYHFEENPYADVDRASLEALYALEDWKARYPASAVLIERYMALIRASGAFARAEERFGPGWREAMETPGVLLHDNPLWLVRERLAGRRGGATGLGVRGNPSWALNKPAELRDALILRLSWLARLGGTAGYGRTLDLLDQAARYYGDPRLDAPVRLNPPTDPFQGPEHEANRVWTEMMASVLKEAGVRLVWFFPPEVNVPPAIYESVFRPGVVESVRALIEPYGHLVVDRTLDHDLNQRDFLVQQFTDPPFSYGYKPSSIGKLKACRLLLGDMIRGAVLPGRLPPGPSCWAGEALLPPVALCVRPYPPLDPDACLPWKMVGQGAQP